MTSEPANGLQAAVSDPKVSFLVVCLIFLAIGLLLYANSLKGDFLWDDIYLVRDNPAIRSFSGFGKLWTADIAAGIGRSYGFYRPLQMASYMVDHFFWGQRVVGYHLTSVLWHVIVAVFVFQLARLLAGNFFVSFFTGLLFLAHPVQTEAVAYIAGRAELLTAAGVLLALSFYIRHLFFPRPAFLYAALFFYGFALFSKEYGFVFLPLAFLSHFFLKEKGAARRLLPFLAVTVIFFVGRSWVLDYSPDPQNFRITTQALWNGLAALTRYLGMLLFPFGLHMGYAKVDFPVWNYLVLLGALFVACACFLGARPSRDSPVAFGLAWFLAGLLPLLNIFYPLYASMAQHWLYLPSIGFFLVLAHGGERVYRRSKKAGLVLMASVLAFYSVRTVQQNSYWKDPIVFYERSLRWEPDNTGFLVNLGIEYNNRGFRERSLALFDRALKVFLENARFYNDQAVALMADGRSREGIIFFEKAVRSLPDNDYLLQSLGRLGDPILAQKVAELTRRKARIFYNLGIAFWEIGNGAHALRAVRKALEIEPAFEEARELMEQFARGAAVLAQRSKEAADEREFLPSLQEAGL